MRVVLDANQFVSGMIAKRGNSARILEAWRESRFTMVISPPILEEIERVLSRPSILARLSWSAFEVEEFISQMKLFAQVVNPVMSPSVIAEDPDDNKYLAAACTANADCIVSGDHHLLNLGSYEGIPVLTATEFLAVLER
jgi:hypothetical protein